MSTVRFVVALTLGATLLVAPATASAHVTVQPPESEAGNFAKLAFRTPNERDDAGTVKLEVNFPTDAPFAFFNVRAVPGWRSTVERQTLEKPLEVFGRTINEVVSKVTWEGGPIPPGGFEEFEVSVGPLPDRPGELVFKALQTYSSGEVVRWIELREPGATEDPEHPAPVLRVTAAEGVGAGSGQAGGGAAGGGAATHELEEDVANANRLAAVGLVVAVAAMLASLAGFVRRRPSTSPAAPPAGS